MTFKTKKTNPISIVFSILVIILVAGGAYLYLSPSFEKTKPSIDIEDNIYWNLRSKLAIKLSDESGIKYYKVIFKDGQKETVLNQEVLTELFHQIYTLLLLNYNH